MIKRENPNVFSKFKKFANNMIDTKANMPVPIILNFKYFIYCLILNYIVQLLFILVARNFIVLTFIIIAFKRKIQSHNKKLKCKIFNFSITFNLLFYSSLVE